MGFFFGRLFIKIKFIFVTPISLSHVQLFSQHFMDSTEITQHSDQSLITSVKDITVVIKLELNEIKR